MRRRTTSDLVLARHLVASHGTRWSEVWDEIAHTDGAALVEPGLPYTVGELRYAVANEMALTLGDLLIRRTHLAFETRDHGVAAAARVAMPIGSLLGWSDAERHRAIDDYVREAESIFTVV